MNRLAADRGFAQLCQDMQSETLKMHIDTMRDQLVERPELVPAVQALIRNGPGVMAGCRTKNINSGVRTDRA